MCANKFQDNEPMVAQAPIVLSDMETRTQVLFQHGIRASTGVKLLYDIDRKSFGLHLN